VTPSTEEPRLIEALVRKYAPIMELNVDEDYWPTTIDAFLPHMIMQTVTNGVPRDFYTGSLDRNVLAEEAIKLGTRNDQTTACLRTRADLNQPSDTQDWFSGSYPGETGVTTYVVVVNGENGKLDIVYWWLFNYNQGKTVASTSWGNHVSDWEHVKVSLSGVNFTTPGHEQIIHLLYDAHGDQTILDPKDAELVGSQMIVHLANGSHEAYPHVGVYDLPAGTHDYCKANAYQFDQRRSPLEIYEWNGTGFITPPAGPLPGILSIKDPNWINYQGRWGNWERGSLFGQISRLESGPGGLFRPTEYVKPS